MELWDSRALDRVRGSRGADSDSLPNWVMRAHHEEPDVADRLARGILTLLGSRSQLNDPWVIICVGSDRSTGDALGPLVGERLRQAGRKDMMVFGTLERPVHATNLEEVLRSVRVEYPKLPVLAVDACLGQAESVGYISLRAGPLRPGTGVNKQLPPVGDLHVVGIVNVGGFMEYFVLQNTRLNLVMRMAHVIADGILLAARVREANGIRDAACSRSGA